MDYSFHSLVLLAGFAVAGLTLIGAIAVGPYGRRGVRMTLGLISFAAFAASAFWLLTYLGLLDERRAIETRLAELRAQALGAGSALACLERTGGLEAACAQALFASPEALAAANFYTAARLDLVISATRYRGPRTAQFNDAIQAVQRSLQQDPFGLTANILVQREGCTAERCERIGVLYDPARVWDNIRQRTFEANLARHAGGWRAPGAAAPGAATPGATLPPTAATPPTGGETRAPIPDKYTLPSAASIPPISIMNDEPLRPAPQAKDRPAASEPAAEPSPPAPAALPRAAREPAQPQQRQPRRESTRPSAPLSISPKQ